MTHKLSITFFQRKYLATLLLVIFGVSSMMLAQSFAQTTITLDTARNSYGPGDTIKIIGQVPSEPNKLVAIQVKDPNGNTLLVRIVKTDESGKYVLMFKLPRTALAGNYNITANANIDGNIVTQAKEITSAVPEFSSAVSLVLVVSIVSMVILSTKNRLLKN